MNVPQRSDPRGLVAIQRCEASSFQPPAHHEIRGLAYGPADADTLAAESDAKKPYGDVKYGDPGYQDDKVKRYPLNDEKHIRSAWTYINQDDNASQYSSDEVSKIKARIVAAWKSKIDPAGPPAAQKKAASASKSLVARVALATLDFKLSGPVPDQDLPPDLRGKKLIKGGPVALWPRGVSYARDGRVFVVDDWAINQLLADGNSQPYVPFDWQHGSDPQHGADNSGYMVGFHADGKYLYATNVYWTPEAAAKLQSGERGPVSPECYTQALDNVTHEPIPDDTPDFDPDTHATWRPFRWLAAALVRVPALRNLPTAALNARTITRQAAQAAKGKEKPMLKLKQLSARIAAAATEDEKNAARAALETFLASEEGKAEMADAGGDGGEGAGGNCPHCGASVDGNDKFCPKCGTALGRSEGASAQSTSAAAAAKDEEAKKLAASLVPFLVPHLSTIVDAAGKTAADQATKDAVETVEKKQAAAARAKEIDSDLLEAEKNGQIVAAQRETWRSNLMRDYEGNKAVLAALPKTKPGNTAWLDTAAGDYDPSISVDKLPKKEADATLSRACAWLRQNPTMIFEQALAAVRGHDTSEEAFHAKMLRSNPDWMKEREERTGTMGVKWEPTLVRSRLQAQPVDMDKLKFIAAKFRDGILNPSLISDDRKMQAEHLQRLGAMVGIQMLSGEAGGVQPTARFPIAGYGYGIYQGTYGGDKMAPIVTGGANEQGYYPIYGKEALRVQVGPDGLPLPVGRLADDKPSRTRKYQFRAVQMQPYGNTQWVDRMDQRAGDSVLPIGVMAQATKDCLDYAANERELIQAGRLRDATQYATGHVKDLSGGTLAWSDPDSHPITTWKGARTLIWRKTGVDLSKILTLMGVDVVEWLSVHPDILRAAQTAGLGHLDQPMAYAPVEMLIAIFGNIVEPTCRIGTTFDASDADTPWGQDVILAVSDESQVLAPRAFSTIVSSGWPITRTLPAELKGNIGSDGADFADLYTVETVQSDASTTTPTTSAVLLQNATTPFTIPA